MKRFTLRRMFAAVAVIAFGVFCWLHIGFLVSSWGHTDMRTLQIVVVYDADWSLLNVYYGTTPVSPPPNIMESGKSYTATYAKILTVNGTTWWSREYETEVMAGGTE